MKPKKAQTKIPTKTKGTNKAREGEIKKYPSLSPGRFFKPMLIKYFTSKKYGYEQQCALGDKVNEALQLITGTPRNTLQFVNLTPSIKRGLHLLGHELEEVPEPEEPKVFIC